jgi:MFS family permease
MSAHASPQRVDADRSAPGSPRWRVTGFLMVAAAINYADRVAISAVFPALREELELSDVTLGLVGSLFLWSYALASPIAGVVADRLPRSAVILGALTLWSVVTGLIGLSTGLVMLCVLRALLGILESPYLPAAVALLGEHHTPATRARAMSAHSIGLNAGVIFGGAFAGCLAEWYGWRAGFWILGGIGLLWALAGRRWLVDAPLRAAGRTKQATTSAVSAVRRVLAIPSFRLLLLAEMLTGVTTWIFLNWLPLYFRESFQMSLGAAGLVGALMLQGAMGGSRIASPGRTDAAACCFSPAATCWCLRSFCSFSRGQALASWWRPFRPSRSYAALVRRVRRRRCARSCLPMDAAPPWAA